MFYAYPLLLGNNKYYYCTYARISNNKNAKGLIICVEHVDWNLKG